MEKDTKFVYNADGVPFTIYKTVKLTKFGPKIYWLLADGSSGKRRLLNHRSRKAAEHRADKIRQSMVKGQADRQTLNAGQWQQVCLTLEIVRSHVEGHSVQVPLVALLQLPHTSTMLLPMDKTSLQSDKKTVLELDLVAYSDVARVIEENLDVQAVKAFQDQIQSFVDTGLKEFRLERDRVVLGTAGDNAILIFEDAAVMHRFAKSVHEATQKHNQQKSVESAKRWFRMGAATGDILVLPKERRIVGTTIARAVRLEAAAQKGELLVDKETFNSLPPELAICYGPEETVAGKRMEQFIVHRCAFVVPSRQLTSPSYKNFVALRFIKLLLAASLFVLLFLAGNAFWNNHVAAQSPLRKMERYRIDAESTLDSVSWQDELPVVLARWKEDARQLDNDVLRSSILENISLMEEKARILAKPAVKASLHQTANALAEAERQERRRVPK